MGWVMHKIIWRGSTLSVGIFLEIKAGFVEERSSPSLTRISLGIPVACYFQRKIEQEKVERSCPPSLHR
ncbi:hypothetical protein R3W88_018040 [Solanum pinnatisectum]|uniref:Uncharacterized protein n=1 Tax=Solanum pinnatisectum TaxID=50273 RepID=A0AAV9L2Z0_9SOLN|nr:hypothetical protein R3W88_018040 [Solanum pinnatisectum]